MKRYNTPVITVIALSNEDIITTSGLANSVATPNSISKDSFASRTATALGLNS